jgi:hypothetical protein
MNTHPKAPHIILVSLTPIAGVVALLLAGAGSLPT